MYSMHTIPCIKITMKLFHQVENEKKKKKGQQKITSGGNRPKRKSTTQKKKKRKRPHKKNIYKPLQKNKTNKK